MKTKLKLVFLAILIIGIVARITFLGSTGFIEPDGYIYYSVVKQTIANHYIIPNPDPLSEFPTHVAYGEHPGLIYLPVAIYAITLGTISPYDIMLTLPLIFGIVGMILTYLITKELTDNPWIPLLAMLFFAVLVASVNRTQVGSYRGDSFIPVLALLPTLVIIRASRQPSKKDSFFIVGAMVIVAIVSWFIWSGGYYVAIAYGVFIVFYMIDDYRKILLAGLGVIAIGILTFLTLYPPNSAFTASISETDPTTISFLVGTYGLIGFFLGLFGVGYILIMKKKVKNDLILYFMLALFFAALPLQLLQIRWATLMGAPIAIFAALALPEIANYLKSDKIFYWSAIAVSIATIVLLSLLTAFLGQQVDYQNPQMFQALAWIKNNTSGNYLTLWPDGSLLEGWANETSASDSIQGQPKYFTTFPQFLYAQNGNFTFLQNITDLNYIWVRSAWLQEANAIKIEGYLSPNMSYNGTNFQGLETDSFNNSALNNGIHLVMIFNNSDSKVYKVIHSQT